MDVPRAHAAVFRERSVAQITVALVGDEKKLGGCLAEIAKADDLHVIACANDLTAATIALRSLRPVVMLADYTLMQSDGFRLLRQARRLSPKTRSLLLGESPQATHIIAVVTHGAYGYLTYKDCSRFLLRSIRALAQGEAWVPRTVVSSLVRRLAIQSTLN